MNINMKESGIVRKSDELCRIVIPKEIRDKLEIKDKGYVIMFQQGKEIIVKKYDETCAFCGKKTGLMEFKDRFVCKKCVKELKEKFKN